MAVNLSIAVWVKLTLPGNVGASQNDITWELDCDINHIGEKSNMKPPANVQREIRIRIVDSSPTEDRSTVGSSSQFLISARYGMVLTSRVGNSLNVRSGVVVKLYGVTRVIPLVSVSANVGIMTS